jgi:excisionase family DNA binding protein
MEKNLTLIEAAQTANLHPDTVRRMVRRGDLPHFRLLNRIRIRLTDLEELLTRTTPASRHRGRRNGCPNE